MGATLLLAATASSGRAQGVERLASPAVPGFEQGHAAANDAQSIVEEVPRGETVERWTRMITTQRYVGGAQIAPAAFAARIVALLQQNCQGATATAVAGLTVSGRPAARVTTRCPASGGQPESVTSLIVAGIRDLHVKQAAARGTNAPDALVWSERMLAATVLCGAGRDEAGCRAGK